MYKCQYEWPMRFEWDPRKNQLNIRKHGIDFTDAIDLFNHPLLEQEDTREAYSEPRWIAIGHLQSLMGVVVYTERSGDVIRIISARKATKQEVRYYEQTIEN